MRGHVVSPTQNSSTGIIRAFVADQRSFAITSTADAPLDNSIGTQAETAADSSEIRGQASVPAGATLTLQVNEERH